MGSVFREAVLQRLRPALRIHGNRREGFFFSIKNDDFEPDWYAFCRDGSPVFDWDCESAARAGFSLYGDAVARLWRHQNHNTWSGFVAEAVVNSVYAFAEDPYSRLHLSPRPTLSWQALLQRCTEAKNLPKLQGGRRMPSVREQLILRDDGNSLIVLLNGANSFLIFEFHTS